MEQVVVVLKKQRCPATNLAVLLLYTTIIPTPLAGVGVKQDRALRCSPSTATTTKFQPERDFRHRKEGARWHRNERRFVHSSFIRKRIAGEKNLSGSAAPGNIGLPGSGVSVCLLFSKRFCRSTYAASEPKRTGRDRKTRT